MECFIEDLDFGENRYVYCAQHLAPHTTGWCTVPNREKTLLEALNYNDALEECRQKGLKLYVDFQKEQFVKEAKSDHLLVASGSTLHPDRIAYMNGLAHRLGYASAADAYLELVLDVRPGD